MHEPKTTYHNVGNIDTGFSLAVARQSEELVAKLVTRNHLPTVPTVGTCAMFLTLEVPVKQSKMISYHHHFKLSKMTVYRRRHRETQLLAASCCCYLLSAKPIFFRKPHKPKRTRKSRMTWERTALRELEVRMPHILVFRSVYNELLGQKIPTLICIACTTTSREPISVVY
jgi:hypothetical protein